MRSRCIAALLALSGIVLADNTKEELLYAQHLNARGFPEMAREVLRRMAASSKPDRARAGKYGLALVTKQQATIERSRFVRALEDGEEPPISREAVLGLYKDARPDIEAYVKNAPEDAEARFLLAELLQEHAEFLAGSAYPDDMVEERKRLSEENRDTAAALFKSAIEEYQRVWDQHKKVASDPDTPFDDPIYIRATRAEFAKAVALFRWALIYPGGPRFVARQEEAVMELDEFFSRHYSELLGAYAIIYLGRCYHEAGLRLGDVDAAETALDYFQELFKQLEEDPAVPATSEVLARAFYHYAQCANDLATGAGKLKRAQPIYFDNATGLASLMSSTLKRGRNNRWALLARLEIARAHAAKDEYDQAVAIAGDVLAQARVEGHRRTAKHATESLVDWVANVGSAGTLAPSLLYQIGESLAAQNRVSNALTFYEKAIASVRTEEERLDVGYPARRKMAEAYRRDRRPLAAARIAMSLVNEFLQSDSQDEGFRQHAAEACNVARLAWKQVQDATNRSSDESEYQRVLSLFRTEFPEHRANADKEFREAQDLYNDGKFLEAAEQFREITPGSPNYWRAQARIPYCYRRLAIAAEQEAKKTEYFEMSVTEAEQLKTRAAGAAADSPKAADALQFAQLYMAVGLADLEKWKETLPAIDEYLSKYPGKYPMRGLEFDVKVRAHLQLGQLSQAEAALRTFKEKLPSSPYLVRSNYATYRALKDAYQKMDGQRRKDAALRAANLWEWQIEKKDDASSADWYFLGIDLREAEQWGPAGEAFASAAEAAEEEKKESSATYFKRLAATMKFRAVLENPDISATEKLKTLQETANLFVDVVIPDKAAREETLQALANPKQYPQKKTWDAVKKAPETLLDAAEVFSRANPRKGVDGRWVAVRLIDALHAVTVPIPPLEPDKRKKLEKYIPLWWKGAELKLETLAAIVQDRATDDEQQRIAKKTGVRFANKLLIEFDEMDTPGRRQRIERLRDQLK